MPLDPSTPVDPGDIYWITLPYVGGSEQSGRRPCVVMSRRSLNGGNTVVVVPLSTNISKASAHKVLLPIAEIIRDIGCDSEIKPSVALCGQVRSADKRAFEGKIGKLSQNAVLAVQLGLTYLFDIR
ncbi:MAG TPA: type II toxin-antitoxin system PemK/MazF family toxin [Verrucomicrobiae bacterium]|nr:type II toxin-antitoxin system PemK/MazF family toxin [Verrucomicrobiae bacterium]